MKKYIGFLTALLLVVFCVGFSGLAEDGDVEEPLTEVDFDCPKNIKVRDRATLFNLLIGLDGYTICSGIISHELNGPEIIARPLDTDDFMTVGIVTKKDIGLSRYGTAYIKALKSGQVKKKNQ